MDFDRYREAFEQAIGHRFFAGNEITALKNGDEIFPAMLNAIRESRESIEFLTFVYWEGDIAETFAETLAERAQAGVRVRVVLDAYGAMRMPARLVETMEDAGVDLRWFRPLRTFRLWRVDKRTHRKILIVDGRVAFTGGVGIAEEWMGDARNEREWRDTHFQIAGPAIYGLLAAFLDDWNAAGPWTGPADTTLPVSNDPEGLEILVVRSSATVGWTEMATVLRTAIDVAHSTLTITTPYFVPDQTLIELLVKATKRGVDVRLLIPGQHHDQPLSSLAGSTSITPLLASGIKIYFYRRTLIHAKLVVVDRCVSVIGSPNLNHRSMGKDEECAAIVLDDTLATVLTEHFHSDLEHSELCETQRWSDRPWWRRSAERAARLLVEQL